HDVADALERILTQASRSLALPFEERRTRRRAQERSFFFSRETPTGGDVEECGQRGLPELVGVEVRMRIARLEHSVSPIMESCIKYSIIGPSSSRATLCTADTLAISS